MTDGTKLRVFVSYSRRDLAFVDALVAALDRRAIDVIIDRRNLPLAVEFQKELLGFIRQADAVIYVLSPTSVGSQWCTWELDQVLQNNKRLVPVLTEAVADSLVPEPLRKINYVIFTGQYASGRDFETRADELVHALTMDLAWVKEHTRIGELAVYWDEHNRDRGLLLRGRDLDEAEAWRSRQPAKAPALTNLHREFILASRADAVRRQRVLVGLSLSAAVIGIVLAGLAFWQRGIAQRNEATANANARRATLNETSALSQLSLSETSRGDTTRALELALQAFDAEQKADIDNPEVETALYQALWRHRELRRVDLKAKPINAWFDRASGGIRVLTEDRIIELDSSLRQTGDRERRVLSRNADGTPGELEDRQLDQPTNLPIAWSADGKRLRVTLPGATGVAPKLLTLRDLPFKPDGAWLWRDSEGAGHVVLKTGDLKAGTIENLAVVDDDAKVEKIEFGDRKLVQVVASGKILFFCAAWSTGYFVKADSPLQPIVTHSYIKGVCAGVGSNWISYSGSENLIAFLPTESSGKTAQPRLIDADTGILVATLGGHQADVVSFDVSDDGSTLLTVSEDGVARLWRMRVGADRTLAERHHGRVLAKPAPDPIPGRMSADDNGGADDALDGANGYLKNHPGRGVTEIVGLSGADLVVAYSSDEIMAFKKSDLTTPLFRKPLDSELTAVVYSRFNPWFLTSDNAGKLKRWSIADGSSATVFKTAQEPILSMRWTDEQAGTLAVVTTKQLLDIDQATGKAEQKAVLPGEAKISAAEPAGGFVTYCAEAKSEDTTSCALLSISTGKVALQLPCNDLLRVEARLGVAYCPGRTEALPALSDLSDSNRNIPVFPDVSSASGLSMRAALVLTPLEPCRRAYISLEGGIADDPYRGEGLLYDFAARREIARTQGDPGTDYQDYGGGKGLPVFCDVRDAAGYASDMLKLMGKPQTP